MVQQISHHKIHTNSQKSMRMYRHLKKTAMQHHTHHVETIPPKMQPQSIAAHSAIKYTTGYDERWRSDLDFSQEPTSRIWAK